MGDVVNLRLARKKRDRAQAETMAAENRAKFGRTKGEKAAEQTEVERLARTVEGAKRDAPDTPD